MLYNLFSVPLIRETFILSESAKISIIDKFLEIEKTEPMPEGKYPKDGYTSFYTNSNILHLKELSSLKLSIIDKVNEVHKNCGLSGKLVLSSSWFSVNRKYSYHEPHHHCPNIWSGVYYLQADDKDATINFINKNHIDTSWPYNATKEVFNDYTSSEKVCKVETGMLLIFPSYVMHRVDQQLSNNDRINIAFNFKVE